MRRPLFGLLGRFIPSSTGRPALCAPSPLSRSWRANSVEAYFSSVSLCSDALRRRLFSQSLARELQGYNAAELLRSHATQCDSEDPLSQAQYADFKTYLPGDILTKVDRASMANSLEVRVPLLDHSLSRMGRPASVVSEAARSRGQVHLQGGLEPHVSQEILHRPKQGFTVPLAAWFRGPLAPASERNPGRAVLHDAGLFNMATVEMLLDQHQAGESDHSAALWSLSMMESFLRQIHGGAVRGDVKAERVVTAV